MHMDVRALNEYYIYWVKSKAVKPKMLILQGNMYNFGVVAATVHRHIHFSDNVVVFKKTCCDEWWRNAEIAAKISSGFINSEDRFFFRSVHQSIEIISSFLRLAHSPCKCLYLQIQCWLTSITTNLYFARKWFRFSLSLSLSAKHPNDKSETFCWILFKVNSSTFHYSRTFANDSTQFILKKITMQTMKWI